MTTGSPIPTGPHDDPLIQEMVRLLRDVEWASDSYFDDDSLCPVCHCVMGSQHEPDCALARAYKDIRQRWPGLWENAEPPNPSTMTNDAKIAKIRRWQLSGKVHPLTCGVDSEHAILEPQVIDGQVALVCPTCGWRQGYIPDIVLTTEIEP